LGWGDSNSGPPAEGLPGGGHAGELTCGSLTPVVTAGARCSPLLAGCACTGGLRTRLVADAFGAPVLRDQGPIGRRVRQGRRKPRQTDHLLPKPDRALLSPARMANGAARGCFVVSVVVRSGTVQDCCECHAVARPSKRTLGTRSHRWFHPDRRVRPSSVTTMLRATGSCRVAVVPDVCWTGEALADQADSQRFLPPSATEPGRPVCRLGWRVVRSCGSPPNGSGTWRKPSLVTTSEPPHPPSPGSNPTAGFSL
jgi:hypothetical protein